MVLKSVIKILLSAVGALVKQTPQRKAYRRIAIVRFGGLGDVICATALIEPLKECFPEAELYYVTRSASAPLLQGLLPSGKIITSEFWDLSSWRAFKRTWLESRVARSLNLDCLLFLHGGHGALASALLFLKSERVGFDFNDDKAAFALSRKVLLELTKNTQEDNERPIYKQMLRVLEPFGIDVSQARPRLIVDAEETAAVRQLLGNRREKRVAFLIGGTASNKKWPIANYARLAKALSENGAEVLILGGPEDAFCEPQFREADPRIRFLAGQLSLRESLAVLSECDLSVGNDTGFNHAAAALGLRQVQIFGPMGLGYGYRSERQTILFTKLSCQPCNSEICQIASDCVVSECMLGVSVSQVQEACESLLEAK